MNIKQLVIIAAAAVGLVAAPISVSTGVAPWQVNSNPVVTLGTIPGVWVAPFGDASWVATTATDGTTGAAAGTYTFSLNLGAWVGTAGSLSLDYSTDNGVLWSITNGSLSGTTSCDSGNASATCFTGINTMNVTFAADSVLTATVVNGGEPTVSPMGLIAGGSYDAVPEPGTYAMVLLGGAAIAAARMRRK